MAEAGKDPSLNNLHSYLDLRLVFGTCRSSWDDATRSDWQAVDTSG
jgi:hypothetical protein